MIKLIYFQVGQVVTGFGTIFVRVEFRTQMTITPCNLSDPNFSGGSGSSQQSAPIWAKSDHFTSAENLDNLGIVRRNVNNHEFGDSANVTTSDESSEAMRIFAASPPEPHFVHKRFSDHYSSNESLGIQKFRSRSNTNQSHKSDIDDSSAASNEVKVGAFATRKISDNAISAEADEDFLELFNLEDDQEIVEKVEQLAIKSKNPILAKSPAKRAILFQDEPEDENKAQNKKTDFILLNTPFSVANAEYRNNPEGDLGVFFKEVQAAPQLKSTVVERCDDMTEASLESQLTSLCLSDYEKKSDEYDELLKVLEATATTSDSDSDVK